MKRMKREGHVCIIGTGYVGVATAIGLAELGWDVVGHDVIVERVRALALGEPPYRERGLASMLRRHLASGRVRFTEQLSEAVTGARMVILAVGTPGNDDGSADLSALRRAVDDLDDFGIDDAVIVLRSTVPPGTTERIAKRLQYRVPVIYSPEFLREGTAVHDVLYPSRVVIGGNDDEAIQAYADLFEHVAAPIVRTSSIEAELIKGYSNAFLAARISLANEVASLCDALGADSTAVLAGIGADPRIGSSFLQPGIGFGGPCFDKDTRSLIYVARRAGAESAMLSAVLAVNDAQPGRVLKILEDELGTLSGTTIGVWGLTFKAGTDDVRHSLAISIVQILVSKGARVRAYDPAIRTNPMLTKCEIVTEPLAAANADALMVLTEWPEFRTIPSTEIAGALRRPIVIDGRNILDAKALAAAGIRYRGVGRQELPRTKAPHRVAGEAVS